MPMTPWAPPAGSCVSRAGNRGPAGETAKLTESKNAWEITEPAFRLNSGEDGFTTFSAEDAKTGLKLLSENPIDFVFTDLKLPGMNGREFLQPIKRQSAALPVVVMTAFGSVETAVEAMKAGASDYVLKPFALSEMLMVIHKELDVSKLREENRSLREALGRRYTHPNIVAQSAKMQEALALVERVAQNNSTVLIGGGTGVGKGFHAPPIQEKTRGAFFFF